MHRLINTWIPLAIVLTYRLIPARIRQLWSGGVSTSHLALAGIHGGGGWGSLFEHGRINLQGPDALWGTNKDA